MSSNSWGSGPDTPDGGSGTSGGAPAPDYGRYDSGASAPSYGAGQQGGSYDAGQQYPAYPQQGQYPQQGAYGQGAYAQQGAYPGYPGGAPQGPPPSRTGPIVALIIGLLMMFGGPIIGLVVGAAQGLSGIADSAVDFQSTSNPGSVELPANVERVILDTTVTDTSGTTDEIAVADMTCTVTGPTGSPVTVTPMATDLGGDASILGPTFTTGEAGSYTVECSTPSTELAVTPPFEIGDVAQAGTAILIGFLAGFVGLVVTIVAIVMLVRANGKRRRMGY